MSIVRIKIDKLELITKPSGEWKNNRYYIDINVDESITFIGRIILEKELPLYLDAVVTGYLVIKDSKTGEIVYRAKLTVVIPGGSKEHEFEIVKLRFTKSNEYIAQLTDFPEYIEIIIREPILRGLEEASGLVTTNSVLHTEKIRSEFGVEYA